MSKEDTSGPAFPATYEDGSSGEYFTRYTEGMTLRDYFAAKAMNGILSDPDVKHDDENGDFHSFASAIAAQSYAFSDAMLEARKK